MKATACALGAILTLVLSAFAADDLVFTSPPNDVIVNTETVKFEGTLNTNGNGGDPAVTITVGTGKAVAAALDKGVWSADNVALPFGSSIVKVETPTGKSEMVITRAKGLTANTKHQKIRFVWTPAAGPGSESVDDVIRDIARKTLSPVPGDDELDGFVDQVRQETVEAFQQAYAGIPGIETHPVNEDGPDVQTIQMLPKSGDIFGQSFFDFANQKPQQTSEIWVGTYRTLWAKYFALGGTSDRINNWAPMRLEDPPRVRATDLAQALGRTAAHEAGHSFGLVGSNGVSGWMLGCDGGHNCDRVKNTLPGADRFKRGWFIMDPGEKTRNQARLAQSPSSTAPTARVDDRMPAVFSPFNRSYLMIIQH